MSPKKNQLYRKLTIYSIGITLLLLLCLPHYTVFAPELEDTPEQAWKNIYFFGDEFLIIGLTPFFILFPLFLKSKNIIWKSILKIFLFILAGLYFGFGLLTTGFAVQDYIPGPGTLLLFALLPELAYLHYMDMWVKYYIKNPNVENAT